MPMIRFPGTVSRPADTMVRQILLISSVLSFADGSLRILPVMHGLSVPVSIFFLSLLRRKERYLSRRSLYSFGPLLLDGQRRMSGM